MAAPTSTGSSPRHSVVRVVDGEAAAATRTLGETEPGWTEVRVAAASICGSDLHLMDLGVLEGRVPGHEFAGWTPDGTAVSVEPIVSCGACASCDDGTRYHCADGADVLGIGFDGGMAEVVHVPTAALVPVPTGLDVAAASLVEPLAVALHGINRAEIAATDRVAVIGAGPVGLAAVACLRARGITADLSARYDHQRAAGERLGARVGDLGSGYDVVVDAVGTSETIAEAVQMLRPEGRIAMLGVFWEPVSIDLSILNQEITLIPAMTYAIRDGEREMATSARILAESPDIVDALITHRFPIDGASDAFAAARDRAGGTIKVLFEMADRP